MFKSSLTLIKADPVESGHDGWDGHGGAGVNGGAISVLIIYRKIHLRLYHNKVITKYLYKRQKINWERQ